MRDLEHLMLIAQNAARLAGNFLKNQEVCRIEKEEGKDIKLTTDKESERVIMHELAKTQLPILSEEYGAVGELKDRYWVLDPLDGSMNYSRGLESLTCVSIALMEKGEPSFGVIYCWKEDEMFWGGEGLGAYCNGRPINTSKVYLVSEAILTTGFPVARDYHTEALSDFIKQVQMFKKIRMFGAAAVMGSMVASGKIDAYIEENIMIWDVAGAAAIVKAAGGEVELVQGNHHQCICKLFANKELKKDYYCKIEHMKRGK